MSPTVALVRHELARWRAFWVVAAAVLVMVLFAPLLPPLESHQATDVWSATGLVVALVYGLGAGLLIGVHLLGSELFQGSLGFYLSLPVRIRRFWCVRLLAAWGTLVLSTTLVAVPALVSWPVLDRLDAFGASATLGYGWLFALFLLVLPTVALALGHSLGIGARARSAWLGVDLLGLVVAGGAWALAVAGLFGRGAWIEASLILALLAVFCLAAVGIGGWRQLEGARAQASALARLESLWTWGILGLGSVLAVLLANGWLAVTPADLTRVDAWRAGPDLVFVTGDYRWRPSHRPLFLVRGPGERFLELGDWRVLGYEPGGVAVSEDGSTMLLRWSEGALRLDLDAMEIEPMAHLPSPRVVAVDADGDRLALALDRRVVLAEGPEARVTGELRVRSALSVESVRFDGDRLVWVGGHWRSGRREVRVFDLESRSVVSEGAIPTGADDWLTVGPRGRLAAVRKPGGLTEVWDLPSSERLVELPSRGTAWGFLADGSFVARTSSRLLFVRVGDGIVSEVDLPPGGPWEVVGTDGSDRIVLQGSAGAEGATHRVVFVAWDPGTGKVRVLAEAGVALRLAQSPWSAALPSGVIPLVEPGRDRYWRLDIAERTLEPVLPRE